jgi:hypothetical protein
MSKKICLPITDVSLTLTAIMIDSKAKYARMHKDSTTTHGGNASMLSNRFLELHDEYTDQLEDFKNRHTEIKKRIVSEKLENWENDKEITKFFKDYENLLKRLNTDCIVELACSAGVIYLI